MVSYSFTGGYISYLNLRGYEPVPDTTDKLFDMLKRGHIEPCLGRNTFINVSLAHPSSNMVMRLHDAVADWSPFILRTVDECAVRTIERRAVTFSSLLNLERHVYSHEGQIQISSEYIQDYMPLGYVIRRASPYKELLYSMQVFPHTIDSHVLAPAEALHLHWLTS
ncbi:hypothetical protein V5799_029301 [Amblyomma americanum]|uniref:Uncharacterized protein n=1 Tax=Amblyomma americanum TaxID=6943 RepID=A0AAQ4ERJ1_AMBAM